MRRILAVLFNKWNRMHDNYRIKQYMREISGKDYRIGSEAYLFYPQNISIGEGTYINGGKLIASPNAKIRIGKNCLISYNVHIRTDMHNYMDKYELIKNQEHTEEDIIIEDDVWIGYGVQIMPGIIIRKGSVIGAGAVVTHSTDPYGVYAGVPAKKIKERS